MEKLKLGLVGCGKMMKNHVKGVNQMDNVEIVAVCDLNRKRAEVVAESLGTNPKIYTSYMDKEFLEDIEAVLIALPHEWHYKCGMYFAQQKKHILMEKPLCNSEEECLNLIEKCKQKEVTLMCAYPVRFIPGYCKLKEFLDSGEYGEAFQMSVWTEQLSGSKHNPMLEDYEWTENSIIETSNSGGGQLFNHGCHYIDLLLWFMGNPVCGTHIGTTKGTPWMLREGTSQVSIKFESGAIGYHGATWGARGTRLRYDVQIHTDKGMLEYAHGEGIIRWYDGLSAHVAGEVGEIQRRTVLWEREAVKNSKETQYEIGHFVDCVRNGKRPITDGETALEGLRVIWALYNAEKNGFVADLRGIGFNK